MPKNILFLLGEPLRLTSFGSRRAIRSISHYSPTGFRGWFRCYPSRFVAQNKKTKNLEVF
jgi:hypothetical protein